MQETPGSITVLTTGDVLIVSGYIYEQALGVLEFEFAPFQQRLVLLRGPRSRFFAK